MKTRVEDLSIKLFADGADREGMLRMYANPLIKGFTTNPTLMKKALVRAYEPFARDMIAAIPDRPISFEVFADDHPEMLRQARKITTWGSNVYVKIPVMNTKRVPSYPLIRELSREGVKVNVTAVFTDEQMLRTMEALTGESYAPPSYLSIFAGRIADTGCDPLLLVEEAVACTRHSLVEIIWASPRELFNVFQADSVGCHIITATSTILKNLTLVGKNLTDYSLETVQMFFNDAKEAGYIL